MVCADLLKDYKAVERLSEILMSDTLPVSGEIDSPQ